MAHGFDVARAKRYIDVSSKFDLGMYEIEVVILDKIQAKELLRMKPRTLEDGREAEIHYDRKLIRINLTGVWELACEYYDSFIDEFIGIILHECLHWFLHVNGIPQDEKLVEDLSSRLQLLSLGHLIGVGDAEERERDIWGYLEWLDSHFRKGPSKALRKELTTD